VNGRLGLMTEAGRDLLLGLRDWFYAWLAVAAIRTPDQRLRVFVSSTLGELAGERAAVRAAIEGLRLTPVMFELGARPHPPRDLYRSYLEQSDVFVGIYGESYGWVAPEMEISGLEDEYLLSQGKPTLLYVKEPAEQRDGRLVQLIRRIEADGRVSYKTFSSAAELGEQLSNDLAVMLTERFSQAVEELPSGTVTMLFTDIEGSTQLVRALGKRYPDVLNEHHRLLREAFTTHDGHEIDTEGDSFFVVFRRATDAVAATVDAQRALARHAWPEGAAVRVRMGLHTGEPSRGGEGYVGLGVHRTARIAAAGHGGQVLVSETTRGLIEGEEPAGVELRDLGPQVLKDFEQPQRLYQVVAEGLPAEFPRLRTLAGQEQTDLAFAGREAELAEAARQAVEREVKRRTRRYVGIGAAAALVTAGAAVGAVLALTGGKGPIMVGANAVGVIDPGSNQVVASIPVGSRPGDVSYGSGSIWVANLDDSTVTRIDPNTQTPLRAIPVPSSPVGLAAGAGAVWVTSSDGSVHRIDSGFDSVTTVRAPPKTFIVGFVLPSPVTVGAGSLWVASNTEISQIDPNTGKVVSSTGSGFSPSGIAVGFGSVWVAENPENQVTRIDLAGGAPTPIPVGQGPTGIAVGAGAVWVTNTADDTVTRIDPATGAAQATITVGKGPVGVAVGAGAVWVANGGDGTVTRIDPATNRPAAIHLGESPTGVTVADGRVWVTVQQNVAALLASAGQGGVLRVPIQSDQDFLNVDPAVSGGQDVVQILDATCAKLLNYSDEPAPAGDRLVPEAARSLPAISDGGKTYTFTIRRGYRFSPPSNQPVTAQTFKETIERTFSPHELTTIPPFSIDDIVGAKAYEQGRARHISGVIASGDTLTIHLTQPAGDLEARLASPNLCAVPSSTPTSSQGVPSIPMAGPYYIALYSPGRLLVLKRNPNYHGPRPHHLAAIEYVIGPNVTQAAHQVETGRADYFSGAFYTGSFPPSMIASLRTRFGPGSPAARTGHQRYFENPGPGSGNFLLVLNTTRPLFRDVDVRKAVAYALDRSALAAIDEKTFGAVRVTDQFLTPGFPGYRPTDAFPPTPDLARARPLIHRRGGIAVLDLVPGQEQLAAVVERDLAPIGIQVIAKTLPVGEWLTKIRTAGAPYDMALEASGGPEEADPVGVLGGLDPSTTFDDPVYARKLRAAERLTGPARDKAYADLDAQFVRDAVPAVPYDYTLTGDFLSSRVGCAVYQPLYGMDLAALCLKPKKDH
jgi:YVTN family beta-propeller protein